MHSFVNKPGDSIARSLAGMAACYPHLLRVNYDPDYVQRVQPGRPGKVVVITGSGSGHEPLPTGYVGVGMLDAACPGPIFTSPTPDQLLAATYAVDQGAGVLYIVKNYAGAVFNSEICTEELGREGITARRVLVHDDVAIPEISNRRGLGAAPLVIRIAGAAAEEGRSLEQVVSVSQRAEDNARSMGFATNIETLPRSIHAQPLDEHTVELGVGIHGEPGVEQRVEGVEEIVERLMQPIVDDLPFLSGDQVLLLVSGLGGTPPLELFLFFQQIHEYLEKQGIHVVRCLVGNFLTSLGRGGCTVTLMRLDKELLGLWDAPVHTPALHW
ncbi:MAG: dihydroxyacetone kinase subunit DhaK [Caldilineaceae bacterium]|nr:dihydroxyacetone kinase subunit DhaK [Caldilineaceae bacterium]